MKLKSIRLKNLSLNKQTDELWFDKHSKIEINVNFVSSNFIIFARFELIVQNFASSSMSSSGTLNFTHVFLKRSKTIF